MNRTPAILLTVIFLGIPGIALGQDPPWDDGEITDLERAVAAEALGELELAEIYYRRAVRQNPLSLIPRYSLARVLEWSGDFKEALKQFQRILQIHPDEIPARKGVGRMLAWLRRYDEALEVYEDLNADFPDMPEIYLYLAEVQAWRRHFREAELWYTRYLPHAEDKAVVYVRLGELAYWRRQYSRAIRHHEKALEEDPSYFAARQGIERVRKALDTEVRLEYEYSYLPQDHDWKRAEMEASAWPHYLVQVAARGGYYRRFNLEEETYLFTTSVDLPYDLWVRFGYGFSPGDPAFLPLDRYIFEGVARFPLTGIDYMASYERLRFREGGVDLYSPAGLRYTGLRPLGMEARYYVVHNLQGNFLGSAYGQLSYFITEEHSVHLGVTAGVDTRDSPTRQGVESDPTLGFYLSGVTLFNRHVGAKASARMQFFREESIRRLWHDDRTRIDVGLSLFVNF